MLKALGLGENSSIKCFKNKKCLLNLSNHIYNFCPAEIRVQPMFGCSGVSYS